MAVQYRAAREPRGHELAALFSVASLKCDTFLIVTGHNDQLSARGHGVLDELSEALLSREETSSYPAGDLVGGTVLVHRYRVTADTIGVLHRTTDRLFDWIEPELPSDPCFLKDERPWMTTMSSDGVLLFTLDQDEHAMLRDRAPGLRLVPTPERRMIGGSDRPDA